MNGAGEGGKLTNIRLRKKSEKIVKKSTALKRKEKSQTVCTYAAQIATDSVQLPGAPHPDRCRKLTHGRANKSCHADAVKLPADRRPSLLRRQHQLTGKTGRLCRVSPQRCVYCIRGTSLKRSGSGSATIRSSRILHLMYLTSLFHHLEDESVFFFVSGSLGCSVEPAVDGERRRRLPSHLYENEL